jgi:hypothetical protein
MRIGVGADAERELAGLASASIRSTEPAKPSGCGVKRPCALGRVAAQRHDLGHAGLGVAFGDLQRFFAGGVDAGEMGRDGHAVILVDRLDRVMGERARGAARAVGDGDELRVEGGENAERVPEPEGGFERFGREELERDPGVGMAILILEMSQLDVA